MTDVVCKLLSKLEKAYFFPRLLGSVTSSKEGFEDLLEAEFEEEPFGMDPVPPLEFNFDLKEVQFLLGLVCFQKQSAYIFQGAVCTFQGGVSL